MVAVQPGPLPSLGDTPLITAELDAQPTDPDRADAVLDHLEPLDVTVPAGPSATSSAPHTTS